MVQQQFAIKQSIFMQHLSMHNTQCHLALTLKKCYVNYGRRADPFFHRLQRFRAELTKLVLFRSCRGSVPRRLLLGSGRALPVHPLVADRHLRLLLAPLHHHSAKVSLSIWFNVPVCPCWCGEWGAFTARWLYWSRMKS